MQKFCGANGLIAGVDEVGRGPLVGAVVAAAVILDPNKPIDGLKDSKKLSEAQREKLYDKIIESALAYGFGRAEAVEIDEINILQASLLAMSRAVFSLTVQPNSVLVDGNRIPNFQPIEGSKINMQDVHCEAIIKGDSKIQAISAASIIAKVKRDRELIELDKLHPEYGFASHKGYPTKQHLAAIEKYGILDLHRKSFGPVKRVLLSETQS